MRIGFMMHSVLDDEGWDYGFLATSMQELSRLVSDLKSRGFRFVLARDWSAATGKSVCLSFDDGYLDNWTILFPWMKENKVPFTIFVNKDFVELEGLARPFGSRSPGYLNVNEIKAMSDSGFVDIQSHSCTHTWYPTGTKIVDIYSSELKGKYPWIQWNENPGNKPFWLTHTERSLDGTPVFENDRSLRARRFLFDEEQLCEFKLRVVRDRLDVPSATDLLAHNFPNIGRLETVLEQEARYLEEIGGNIDFLESVVGYRSDVLCWPGGAYNEISTDVAKRLGLVTTTRRGFGHESMYMHRISPTNHYGRDKWPWTNQGLMLGYYLARYRFKGVLYKMGVGN